MKIPVLFSILVLVSSTAFCQTKTYYKGNTHAHSLWSDGNDFPEMIVDFYHKNGYQFACLSDHDILQEGEKFITEEFIAKRKRSKIGVGAIEKCEARFGKEWIARKTVDGKPGVVLKTLEDFRGEFEKPGEFLIVKSEEISNSSKTGAVHVNAINVKEVIPSVKSKELPADEVMRQALQAVIAQEKKVGKPILAHLNHPNFQWAVTPQQLAAVAEEQFFEVYNGHPGINHFGKEGVPGDEAIWDIANTIRIAEMGAEPLYGVATDDSHTYHGGDVSPGRGWIMVAAKELSGDALVNAMRAGDFYSSSGVTLKSVDFVADGGAIEIAIEEDGDAVFTSELIGTRKGYDAAADEGKTGIGEVFGTRTGNVVRFEIPKDALYARVTITSSKGHVNPSFKGQKKQAWTQPVGW
ncbi:MAG: PHP domain-containing protein [Verrucomicrobiales bacterium]